MVKLTQSDKAIITDAIAHAESKTRAEIAVMLTRASDHYLHHGLILGIILGSAVSLGLWYGQVAASFPLLLLVQLAVIALCAVTPALGRLIVPKREQHLRAQQKALAELARINAALLPDTPVLLLHLSLAERHVSILPNGVVRALIKEDIWQPLIDGFTASLAKQSLPAACAQLIDQTGALLAQSFPDDGAANLLDNQIIGK